MSEDRIKQLEIRVEQLELQLQQLADCVYKWNRETREAAKRGYNTLYEEQLLKENEDA